MTLWVRETWADAEKLSGGDIGGIIYRADGATEYGNEEEHINLCSKDMKWKPSIHMPRWASRITLEVVSVRVERVQDITYEGMKAEGCLPKSCCGGHWDGLKKEYWIPLWNSINAKRGYGWDVNPFCWVVEFKRVL